MLSVNQVSALRRMGGTLAGSPAILDHLSIQSERVSNLPQSGKPIAEWPTAPGTLRKPQRIFGSPVDPSCLNGVANYVLPLSNCVVRRVESARIIGTCVVLGANGDLYVPDPVDVKNPARALARNSTNHEGFLLHQLDDGLVASFVARRAPRFINLKVVFFHNIEPGNYGSFLIRQLPQMEVLRPFCEECDAYVTPAAVPWFLEALDLLKLPTRPVFTVPNISGEFFTSVTFANDFDDEGFMRTELRARIRSRFGLDAIPRSDRPIYVSRSLNSIHRPRYRVLLNEDQIEQEVAKRGFEIIYPEALRLIDQAKTFAGARRVVGPSGSGMLNILFGAAGARVLDMESTHVTVRQHAKVYCSAEAEYSFLFGLIEEDDRPLHQRSWSVPESLFFEGLDWVSDGFL